MRARMSLLSAEIRCELREVVLRDKPAEMIAITTKATVPVMQLPDGTVIDESLDIMRWALKQNDPEHWLAPDSAPLDNAIALIDQTEVQFKPNLDRYKYPDRYPGTDPEAHRTAACEFLALLEARLNAAPCLFGDSACIADMAIFPFIRQFANTDNSWFDATPFTQTQKWLTGLISGSHFVNAMKKYAQWRSGDKAVVFPLEGKRF